MKIDRSYFEILTLSIQESMKKLQDSFFENFFSAPFIKVDLAFYHFKKLFIFRPTNGVEVDLIEKQLPACDSHHSISLSEKIKLVDEMIDESNDIARYPGSFDYYRAFEAIRVLECEKTDNDYYLVYSFDSPYLHIESLYALEIINRFTQHWKRHILVKYDFPSDILERDAIESMLSLDEVEILKHEALEIVLKERAGNITEEFIYMFSTFDILSSKTYEKRTVLGSLIFAKDNKIDKGIRYVNPIPIRFYYASTIRKVLETTGGHSLVVFGDKIIGMGYTQCYPLRINFLSFSKWDCVIGDNTLFCVKNGHLYIPIIYSQMDFRVKFEDEFPDSRDMEYKLHIIVDEAKKQKHGTSIVISTDAENEAKRLCNAGRGFLIEPIDLYENHETVEQLTAIDGALFVDQKGICYAIGVIVDGEAVIKGDISRGARFNSLTNYIAWKKMQRDRQIGGEECNDKMRYLAVIISEDQNIDFYTTKDIDNE
jgi:hypothetical protein